MKKIRKGFTLIELLVVVSVLGSLAAMMSIASGEAMTSAKAAKIINNLRNFAAAANEYYTDNMNRFYGADATKNAPQITEIRYYMNEGSKTTSEPESLLTNYYVATEDVSDKSYAEVNWYVGYAFPEDGDIGAEESEAIKIKLAGRAKEIGLYGTDALEGGAAEVIEEVEFAKTHGVIWFKAREKSRRGS